jgi:hypothetical protein
MGTFKKPIIQYSKAYFFEEKRPVRQQQRKLILRLEL